MAPGGTKTAPPGKPGDAGGRTAGRGDPDLFCDTPPPYAGVIRIRFQGTLSIPSDDGIPLAVMDPKVRDGRAP
jgi:hypothetical protein